MVIFDNVYDRIEHGEGSVYDDLAVLDYRDFEDYFSDLDPAEFL